MRWNFRRNKCIMKKITFTFFFFMFLTSFRYLIVTPHFPDWRIT